MESSQNMKAMAVRIAARAGASVTNSLMDGATSHLGVVGGGPLALPERTSVAGGRSSGPGATKIVAIALEAISPNPWQPRTYFDPEEIAGLAASIAEVGLIQPIIVRRVPTWNTAVQDQGDPAYQLIAGERRWRAHKELGATTINAVVVSATDDELAGMALAENLNRADLSDFEISKAIRRAEREFPNRKRMAEAIGIGRTDLYRYFSFDALPAFVKADLEHTPRLLSRVASEQVAIVLKAHGVKAIEALATLWKRVKAGQLEQSKLAGALTRVVMKDQDRHADRNVKMLFVGKEQAGSITRGGSWLTIKIRAAALNSDQETELRTFVEGLLKA